MKNISQKPTNTENLRFILERIWSGELPHNQKEYVSVCGSYRCVAGWDYYIRYGTDKILQRFGEKTIWEISQEDNNLSDEEAELFFNGNTNRKIQEKTLLALESGKRLILPKYSKLYFPKGKIFVECLGKHFLSVKEFLGEELVRPKLPNTKPLRELGSKIENQEFLPGINNSIARYFVENFGMNVVECCNLTYSESYLIKSISSCSDIFNQIIASLEKGFRLDNTPFKYYIDKGEGNFYNFFPEDWRIVCLDKITYETFSKFFFLTSDKIIPCKELQNELK